MTPIVRARPATPSEIPANARRLVATATEADWTPRACYARGTTPEGQVVDSLVVYLAHAQGARAVAIWENRRFRAAYVRTRYDIERLGLRALTGRLGRHTLTPLTDQSVGADDLHDGRT